MKELTSPGELESIFTEDTAILYKHSTQCPISAAAHRQIESFLEENPDAPVYMVDVHASAGLSDAIVEKTGIDHQSPQIILLRGGKPTWTVARGEVKADALTAQLRDQGS